jgi:hypothetical protein
MKTLGCLLLVALTAVSACKRADPKETQMSGEANRGAPMTAEPPIAAPGERIAAPGEKGAGSAMTPAAGATTPASKDASFVVAVQVPDAVAAGSPATASVKVTPGAGYKVNQEYPIKLTIDPTEGVSADKPVQGKADVAAFDEHQLAFAVKLTPAKAGTYTINGKVAFAVCTAATCDPKTEKIAINLVVK